MGYAQNTKEAAWSCHMVAKANESPERAWAEQLPCANSPDGRNRPHHRQTTSSVRQGWALASSRWARGLIQMDTGLIQMT